MKEITTSKGTFLFVEVPDDAANISMSSIGNLHYDHSFEGGVLNMHQMHIVDLFDTSLKFICTTKNATEEQAAMVVDGENEYYKHYCKQSNLVHDLANDSLHTLLLHNKLYSNYAIIQKL